MELARIVAMFLVLVVHACFMSLGWPSHSDLVENSGFTAGKLLVESLSIVCVNLFVLISGWYGIHFKIKKLASLLFQVFYFSVLIYGVLICLRVEHLGVKGVASVFMLTEDYWFIKSYIFLMLLSPLLNKFIESASRRQLLYLVVSLMIFQTVFGWTDAALEFKFGYSALSFIVLYLLARYLRLYADKICNVRKIVVLGVYFLTYIINAAITFFLLKHSIVSDALSYMYAYNNPLIILASVCLLLFFNKLSFRCRWVNVLAASCLSVYLLHTSPFLFGRYLQAVRTIFFGCPIVIFAIVKVLMFALIVFLVSFLLDQPRKALWSLIEKKLTNSKENTKYQ